MPKKIKYEYHEPCEAALSERIEMRKVKVMLKTKQIFLL